jgi:hypothetical protein
MVIPNTSLAAWVNSGSHREGRILDMTLVNLALTPLAPQASLANFII